MCSYVQPQETWPSSVSCSGVNWSVFSCFRPWTPKRPYISDCKACTSSPDIYNILHCKNSISQSTKYIKSEILNNPDISLCIRADNLFFRPSREQLCLLCNVSDAWANPHLSNRKCRAGVVEWPGSSQLSVVLWPESSLLQFCHIK